MLTWSTADFYGATSLIGSKGKGLSSFPAVSWTHGCIFGLEPEWPVILSKHELIFKRHLVTNVQQQDILSCLNKDVRAVGLPFGYAHRKFYQNVPRTIKRLYMPSHSISGQSLYSDGELLASRALKEGCSDILLNQTDFRRLSMGGGNDTYQLNKKVRVIKGADITDSRCLERMVKFFQSVSMVITDSIGSHLYYATLCGCDVRIIELHRPPFASIEKTLSKMTSPWKEAYARHYREYAEGDKYIRQASCFMGGALGDRLDQTRQMMGIDCLLSDDQILKATQPASTISNIKVSAYLAMRKARIIRDY
ncbi:MAG: hypothetical protein HOO95_06345 [Gallionella sp.]|nr:hypothetical protein [Gallionella sp.]